MDSYPEEFRTDQLPSEVKICYDFYWSEILYFKFARNLKIL